MITSEFKLHVSQLERLIGIMYEISQLQQSLLINEQFEKLKVNFELRNAILEKIKHDWASLESEDGFKQTVRKDVYDEEMKRLRKILNKVMDSDKQVTQLIEHKSQQIKSKLFEMVRAKEGAKDYKSIEQLTGIVGRVFPENTRFIDEKR